MRCAARPVAARAAVAPRRRPPSPPLLPRSALRQPWPLPGGRRAARRRDTVADQVNGSGPAAAAAMGVAAGAGALVRLNEALGSPGRVGRSRLGRQRRAPPRGTAARTDGAAGAPRPPARAAAGSPEGEGGLGRHLGKQQPRRRVIATAVAPKRRCRSGTDPDRGVRASAHHGRDRRGHCRWRWRLRQQHQEVRVDGDHLRRGCRNGGSGAKGDGRQ